MVLSHNPEFGIMWRPLFTRYVSSRKENIMYKQSREFIVTIRYNSNNNDPESWTSEDLEKLAWLEDGEAIEIVKIDLVKE